VGSACSGTALLSPVAGVLLEPAVLADVDRPRTVAQLVEVALFLLEGVLVAEFGQRRGFGLEVCAAFFGEGRTAHSRHPRQ
jgi:hypothetical protein